jgi:hypothetical protein
MLRHAGGDALDIGNVLIAQAHRIALAGGALLGRPLRGCRLPRQRNDQRGNAEEQCAMRRWQTNPHGRISLRALQSVTVS